MRRAVFVLAVALLASSPAIAQDWEEYTNIPDGFKVNFPGQPKVTDTTWTSQLNFVLPARVYSAERGPERYSVTVVDYRPIEQLGVERAKACPPGNANCRGNAGPVLGAGYARHDERGALVYATFKFVQRDAKVDYLSWEWMDLIEGHSLQLTNNADKSRTFAWIGMHEQRLYIVEGTVPAGRPEPGLFQQSIGFVDKNGTPIRYQNMVYSNSYHGMGVYPTPPYPGGPAR
jgi:hypothetical protein